jgi:hypothetical protein
MKIEDAYSQLLKWNRPCQVFCWTQQELPSRRHGVWIVKIIDQTQANRRERENYDRFIGIFDPSISLADFAEACIWACEERRLVDRAFERLLQPARAGRVVGLPNAERVKHPLEQRAAGSQNPDSRNAVKGSQNRAGHPQSERNPSAGNRGTVRPAQGQQGQTADQRGESQRPANPAADVRGKSPSRKESAEKISYTRFMKSLADNMR